MRLLKKRKLYLRIHGKMGFYCSCFPRYITVLRLLFRNVPHIHIHDKWENKDWWHGSEIQIVIEGNWTTYQSKVLHYMRQLAIITPYAQFLFQFVSDAPEYYQK
ncbi:hypothetical protein H5410_036207 [Solanum commersonii]|uniref:Topoisomerase VI n=1 Tax=Solanum commersonii TaxID=4109 RepID=A0A9J5Y500_SOLCO|nr:hypothetical protein H5410_036207 [Solanum commersonii]